MTLVSGEGSVKFKLNMLHTYIHTDRQTDRHTDRQTYRHTDRQTLYLRHGKNISYRQEP